MNHPKRQLLILGALVILAFYGALAFGTKTLTPAEIWHGFLARDFDIWQYRLPRAILAIYIGAALALSGTIIQGIIHNPLASPDILGINHGASLAAVLTLTFISNLPLWALPLAACLGAAAAFAILLALTRKNTGPLQMALIGVALSALYAAIADYLLLTWPQNLNTAMVWLTGSLWNRSWVFVQIAVPVLTLLLPLAFFASKTFDLLTLGDQKAATLGVSVRAQRNLLLALAVVLAAVAVSVAGPITFLGLVAPHLARKLVGGRHIVLLPAALLTGALILQVSDIAVRSIKPPLELPAGIFTALIGPNGCGKSTLLKTLARLLPPQSGDITLDGEAIYHMSPRRFARRLSLLPQHHMVPEGINVRTLVGYGRSPYLNLWGRLGKADLDIVARVMAATHTDTLADKRVDELSGGQQQRAFLAMTLAQETPYLLLDEPTTYLDLNHQIALMDMMRAQQEKGTTVITVLHDLNQAARYCDHLIVLKAGQLVAEGSPAEVLTPALLADVFAVNAAPYTCPVSGKPMCIVKESALEAQAEAAGQ
ncbi:MAG: iron chelate uptake ABC transporter family permease subunit [Cardiobacterium hominis]